MAVVTRNCDQCAHATHWSDNSGRVHLQCLKGHRPRFYTPLKGNPYSNYGWKRRCEDYEESKE
jgi:hypothetical protein